MSHPLVFSYVFTLLCLLLGTPYLLYKVIQRVRGSARSILHGCMLGIGSQLVLGMVLGITLIAALPAPAGVLRHPMLSVLLGGAWALGLEGLRAVALTHISTQVREPRSAAHFGLGWGCGVAMLVGVQLLVVLYQHQRQSPMQMVDAFPASMQEDVRTDIEKQRAELFEISPLKPPLEHVLRSGFEAFFHLAFTLVLVRRWTRGLRNAWLRAAGFHASLRMVTLFLEVTFSGWWGLVLLLLVQVSLVPPTYRWMARQIVKREA
ncbi:MAG: YhfC family glutamic-type intramembrane protease [Acidobacteriota bacterium]